MRATTLGVLVAMMVAVPSAQAKGKPRHKPATDDDHPKKAAEKASEDVPEGDAETGGGAALHAEIGPKRIELGDDLVLDLPAGMGFLARDPAKRLMERDGNIVGNELRGLVFKQDSHWIVTIDYVADGYVKDDEAADLKPDDILQSIREGTEEENQQRKERGFSPMHVDGWTEPPRYDRARHHLIWGIKGSDEDGSSINFYTRVLGRRGYVALNLIDDPARIEASKLDARAALAATTFKPGARYEDFDKKKDKVAEYGLAALVAGGAGAAAIKLAKVGLLAKFGGKLLALLIAGKKVLAGLFIALVGGLKSLLGRRKRAVADAAAAGAPGAVAPPGEGPPTT
jgi:uncharacterized membrane-anchored protein